MSEQEIHKDAGALVTGNVNTSGGDFIGRDKINHGDEVSGDKIGGVHISGLEGNIYGSIIAGRDVQVTVITTVDSQKPTELRAKPGILFQESVDQLKRQPLLFGRNALLTKIDQLIDEGRHVLLFGLAGVGKTAVATALVDQRIRADKGSVIWSELADADANAFFDALVQRFAKEEEKQILARRPEAMIEIVSNLLVKSKAELLVLDNVWNSTALFEIKKAIPAGLPLLVTSRYIFPQFHREEVGNLSADEALKLLGYCAGGKDYIADKEAHKLCHQLGYHAYAIEIAGATLQVDEFLTPGQLCQQITNVAHSVSMPVGFAEDGRESVKQLLDRSFYALDVETQAVFQALGAFFFPQLTSTLLAVFLHREKTDVDRLLRELVLRSLLKRIGTDYYTLHDLTFSYARSLSQAQANSYQTTITAVQQYVIEHAQNFDSLAFDMGNILKTALVARTDNVDALIDVMQALATKGYVDTRGHSLNLLMLLNDAIGAIRQRTPVANELLHYLAGKQGNIYFDRGNFEDALTAYQVALECAPNANRKAILLAIIGRVLAKQGKFEQSDDYFRQGYAVVEAANDETLLCYLLEQQTYVASLRGNYDLVRDLALRGINASVQSKNRLREASFRLNLGSAEFHLGVQKALSSHQAAYTIAQEQDYQFLMASALNAIGIDYHALEDYDQAKQHLQQAHTIFSKTGQLEFEEKLALFMKQFGYSTSE